MEAKVLQPMIRNLYDLDFFEWAARNADLLRAGRFDEADIEHITEELEDMGKRERREMESRLEILLTHLLKWRHQPDARGPGWKATIKTQRLKINKLLRQMPSLRRALPEDVPDAYEHAVTWAAVETGLSESSFPETCPFMLDQILDPGFWPN